MSTIFISHNSADRAWAERIREWLKQEGHDSVYLAFHPEDGTGVGVEWQKDLYRKIRACSVMVVLWSRASRESDWCFAEIAQARALGRDVFPLKVGDVDEHPLLYGLQFVDMTIDEEEGFERLRAGLRRVGVDDSFKWDSSRPPYPGFLAFDQADAAVYFGREPEIRKSLNLLNQIRMHESSRLLLVLGASGSGKSSLVRAGVYPRLCRDPEDWLLVEPFRPRGEPLKELAVVLAEAFVKVGHPRSWTDIEAGLSGATEAGGALIGVLEDLLRSSPHRDAMVVLFVDQLEELLGHSENHPARMFLRMLRAALLIKESPLVVLGTMRSDSLPTFQQDESLVEIEFENVSLAPLGRGRLREIIEGPARVADVEVQPGVIDGLLDEARTGDSLPLLAFTLRELYERYADDQLLELTEYEDLDGLKGAVKKAAEQAAGGLDEEELAHLRRAFLRLVRVSEEGQYLRRPALLSELPEAARPTVQRFVDRRLLISREHGADTSIEVAHEALFRSWDRLRTWLELDREALLVHHRVEASAALWKRENESPEYLWRGARLDRTLLFAEAGGWAWTDEATDELQLTQEFLEASVAAQKASDQAEADQAQRLSEARRQREKVRNWLILVLVASVVALGAFLWINDRQERELSDTLARNYWQRARDAASTNPLLAAQLLAQALATANDPDLIHSLHISHGSNLRYLSLEEILESAGQIMGATFSDDGERILTWGDEGIVHLWQRSDGARELSAPRWELVQEVPRMLAGGQVDPVKGAAFGPDDESVLVWTSGGSSRLWSVEAGRLVTPDFGLEDPRGIRDVLWRPGSTQGYLVRVPNRGLDSAVFPSGPGDSPSSPLAAIAHPEMNGRRPNVFGGRFDAAGARLLTWSADGSVRLWDVETGYELACFQHGSATADGWVLGARFDSAEARVLTWGRDGQVRLWPIDSAGDCETAVITVDMPHEGAVTDAVFAGADDRSIVTWTDQAIGSLWATATGDRLGSVQGAATPRARLGADGRVLVWGQDRAARVWTLEFGGETQRDFLHGEDVSAVIMSPDQQRLLSVDWDGVAKLWGARGEPLASQRHLNGEASDAIRGAIYAPDGEQLALWHQSGAIHLWDKALAQRTDLATGHQAAVLGAAFIDDGRRLLSWSRDGTARLWDLAQGREVMPHPLRPGDDQWIEGALWNEEGEALWTWTDKGLLTLWDMDGNPSERSNGIAGAIHDEAGARLLIWDERGRAELIDAATGETIQGPTPIDQGQPIDGALFGGETLLTWTRNGPAHLWHLETGRSVELAQPDLSGAAFGGPGPLAVTWSETSVNLWDRNGGRLRTLLLNGLKGARVSPNGRMILTWDHESRGRLWDVGTGLSLVETRVVECVTGAAFDEEGRRIVYWCDRAPVAGLWEVPGDVDYPSEHVPLELQVRTGRRFNLETQEEEPLDRQTWLEAKARYREVAEEHLEECGFANNNVYRRFYESRETGGEE